MPLNTSIPAITAASSAALLAWPAYVFAATPEEPITFPEGFPHISRPSAAERAANAAGQAKPTGEDTPLNLGDGKAADHLSGGGGGGLVRTIVGLAVVIGVIYGITWVLKQVKTSREAKDAGPGLENIATVNLGPNRALHLVRSGREIVLVGAAETGVTPIRVYSMEEARTLGLLEADQDEALAIAEADAFDEVTPGVIPRQLPAAPGGGTHRTSLTERPSKGNGPDFSSLLRRAQEWTVRS